MISRSARSGALLAVALASVAHGETTTGTATNPPAGHRLVWSDEFDKDGLPDPAR
jgi:hypothetical protein